MLASIESASLSIGGVSCFRAQFVRRPANHAPCVAEEPLDNVGVDHTRINSCLFLDAVQLYDANMSQNKRLNASPSLIGKKVVLCRLSNFYPLIMQFFSTLRTIRVCKGVRVDVPVRFLAFDEHRFFRCKCQLAHSYSRKDM